MVTKRLFRHQYMLGTILSIALVDADVLHFGAVGYAATAPRLLPPPFSASWAYLLRNITTLHHGGEAKRPDCRKCVYGPYRAPVLSVSSGMIALTSARRPPAR